MVIVVNVVVEDGIRPPLPLSPHRVRPVVRVFVIGLDSWDFPDFPDFPAVVATPAFAFVDEPQDAHHGQAPSRVADPVGGQGVALQVHVGLETQQ